MPSSNRRERPAETVSARPFGSPRLNEAPLPWFAPVGVGKIGEYHDGSFRLFGDVNQNAVDAVGDTEGNEGDSYFGQGWRDTEEDRSGGSVPYYQSVGGN